MEDDALVEVERADLEILYHRVRIMLSFYRLERSVVMTSGNIQWLRERLQDPAPPSTSASASAARDGATALELVYQAAEVIQAITDRAHDAEARAKWIVESAIGKLQAAESRHEAEQSKQRELLNEATAKLAEAGKALSHLQLRITIVEAERSAAEVRAKAAEARANEAEAALRQIEEAIRAKLLGGGQDATIGLAAAA